MEQFGMFWDESTGREFDWDEYNRERQEAYEIHEKIKWAREQELLDRAAEVCRGYQRD